MLIVRSISHQSTLEKENPTGKLFERLQKVRKEIFESLFDAKIFEGFVVRLEEILLIFSLLGVKSGYEEMIVSGTTRLKSMCQTFDVNPRICNFAVEVNVVDRHKLSLQQVFSKCAGFAMIYQIIL